MLYNGQPSPTNVQYPSYHPDRRSKTFWFLAVSVVILILSVAALIIVFSVEHSWFSDNFNQTTTSNYLNHYGLWRLCFYSNQTCDSWFSTDGPSSSFIYARLNQAKVGINSWQALEIVFLFLTTSTLIFTLVSFILYRLKKGIHFYLAILAAFCAWPAVCVGISGLFVFGFSVYNVAPTPRNLDWCFYLNIVAVVLTIIAAILLTVYDVLLKPPRKLNEDDAPLDTFTDYSAYPSTYSPSTYVIVRRNKKKRNKPYEYPQVLYPQQYYSTQPPNTEFITNPNYQMMTSYSSPIPQQQGFNTGVYPSRSATSVPPPSTRYYQPPVTAYRYQPPHWRRTDSNPINYSSEPPNDYIQRGIYRPARLHPVEPKDEARVLHYYTGHDQFSAADPSDVILTRHQPPYPERASPPARYSYYSQNDYIKSAM